MGFRKDIEGLRALAVLLVLFYHAGFDQIRGGFIGVDVFFVISGFLITSLIRKEIRAGYFSFWGFYSRRVKRIFPLLAGVTLATWCAGIFILAPEDLSYLSKSVVAAVLSVSNIFFAINTSGYFAQSSEQLPLVHTWSLSVEEQFYVVLPILLVVSHKFLSYGTRAGLFVVAFVASLAYSVYAAEFDQVNAYYQLPSRAFELMVGAGLALCWDRLKVPGKIASEIMSVAGLLVVTVFALTVDKQSHFPGLTALMPCMAVALVIYSGKAKEGGAIRALLSSPGPVFVGRISYSLYLWHWPIVAFLHYRGLELTTAVSWAVIAASFALSIFSYQLIEHPFRRIKNWSAPATIARLYAGPGLALVCLALFAVQTGGMKWRLDDELQREFSEANSPGAVYRKCFNSYSLERDGLCSLGASDKPVTGIFLGDSMAGHYMSFMDELAKDAGIQLVATASSGLPPFPVKSHPQFGDQRTKDRLDYNSGRIEFASGFTNVFIAVSWANGYPYLAETEAELFESIEKYIKSGANVYLVARPNNTAKEIFNKVKDRRVKGENISSFYSERDLKTNYYLDVVKRQIPQVRVIDPNLALCESDRCAMSFRGRMAYFDHAHLTDYGSRELARIYLGAFGNPLTDTGT